MEQFSLQLAPLRPVYRVGELNARIRALLDDSFGDVWVSGEVTGAKLAPSGHWYFTLKDGDSSIKCACFRMNARYLKFKPRDGIAVIARGRIDVYEARGEYQLIVEHLEPQGHGALQLAFEQLKKELAAEGLFEQARKRPLPKLPRRIGIVTSPSGAVIQDMIQILERRFPGLWIRLYPALVQGEGSIDQVVRGIRHFSETGWAEVVIVARGGGSIEDLWTFNEEAVARAIAASSVPVISAIGHETDFTIADFVADLRAPTPSAAAELVICTRDSLLETIDSSARRMEQILRYRLSHAARRLHEQGVDRAVSLLQRRIGRLVQRVDEDERALTDAQRRVIRDRADRLRALDARLRHMDLRLRFADVRRRLEALDQAARLASARRIQTASDRLRLASAKLEQLSPLRVLERGYSIVQTLDGAVVKSALDAPPATALRIRLSKGELEATVD